MEIYALIKKLKIKEGVKILILNSPLGFIQNLKLSLIHVDVSEEKSKQDEQFDLVILFILNSDQLHQFGDLAIKSVVNEGILWIAYPKKSSGIKTDLTRDEGWAFLDPYMLRAVSNIAIDDIWSGLRFKTDPEGKSHNERMAEYKNTKKNPEERIVMVPDDLQKALDGNPAALQVFNKFAYTHRKEYVRWVETAKKKETRENRIKKTVEMISEGLKFS